MSSFALCSLTESADLRYPTTKRKRIMAAPSDITTLDTSGVYVLNKTLSDDTDDLLRLQGVSWFTRSVIRLATITLSIKHYHDASDPSVERIDIDQTLTGGISGTREERVLTWTPREHNDHIFGDVIGKSRRVTDVKNGPELEDEWLKNGWTEDTYTHGVVQSYVESNTPKSGTTWIVSQTWGFEVVNDERRYARHLKFTGPKNEDLQLRLVYDYQGPLP